MAPQQPTGFIPDGFEPDAGPSMNFAIVNGQRVPVDDQNTVGTFAKHFVDQINPIPLGQLLPFPKSLGGAGMDAPVQAVKNVLHAQNAVKEKADAAWKRGDHIEALGHYLDWLVPVLGPVLDKAGDELRTGQYSAGAGDTAGFAANIFGPSAFNAAKGSEFAQQIGARAERGAVNRAVSTMAPQVGPNKVRLGNLAADVGPTVLRDTSAITRSGMLEQAGAKLDSAYQALDAAYDSVPDTRMYPTGPIILGLQREIKKLSVSGAGGVVEPATRASRISSLRQAVDEAKGLGPSANLDNLRKLRISWDEGAQGMFTPAVAQDFLKARGTGSGWADARSVLNDFMTSQHPELSPLNADASLWKKAVDVMQAAEEADRVRPTVGRSIMARGLGAATGGAAEGAWGAVVGGLIGPSIERVIANLQPSMKILMGRQMANLAEAIRAHNVPRARSLIGALKTLIQPALTKAGQAASGSLQLPMSPMPETALATGRQP